MWAVGYILDFDSDSWLLKGFLLIILFFLTSLFPRCVLVFAKLVIAFPILVLFFTVTSWSHRFLLNYQCYLSHRMIVKVGGQGFGGI